MTARLTKVVVPVSAMKRDTLFRDIADPGHTRQVKAVCAGQTAVDHVTRRAFVMGGELTGWGEITIGISRSAGAAHHCTGALPS